MAFGLESRVPFVDHVLVEWIARLPADLRLRDGWTKRILRDAFADIVPPLVRFRRSKLGFSSPDAEWLDGPLNPWLADTLTRPAHLPSIVDPAGVAQLLEMHRQKRGSRGTVAMLFRLAASEHWGGLFLGSRARRPTAVGM